MKGDERILGDGNFVEKVLNGCPSNSHGHIGLSAGHWIRSHVFYEIMGLDPQIGDAQPVGCSAKHEPGPDLFESLGIHSYINNELLDPDKEK